MCTPPRTCVLTFLFFRFPPVRNENKVETPVFFWLNIMKLASLRFLFLRLVLLQSFFFFSFYTPPVRSSRYVFGCHVVCFLMSLVSWRRTIAHAVNPSKLISLLLGRISKSSRESKTSAGLTTMTKQPIKSHRQNRLLSHSPCVHFLRLLTSP